MRSKRLTPSLDSRHAPGPHLAELSQVRVCVRDEQDHAAVGGHIHEQLGKQVPVIYLGGDLCRKNLLVEVEGLYAG